MEGFFFTQDNPLRVFAYRNLTSEAWSLRALDGEHKGKVVIHATDAMLTDAAFVVSEAGRQRVLRERQKNVHAGVIGTVVHATVITERYPIVPTCRVVNPNGPLCDGTFGAGDTLVTYNPYKYGTFVHVDTGKYVDNDEVTDVSLHSTFEVSVFDLAKAMAAAA